MMMMTAYSRVLDPLAQKCYFIIGISFALMIFIYNSWFHICENRSSWPTLDSDLIDLGTISFHV